MGVVGSLMTAIAPVALSAMTMWVILYGWAVLRHEVAEPVSSFVWKLTKIGLLLAVALQSSLYAATVSDSATDLATSVATTLLPSSAPKSTNSSPYALLVEFNDNAGKQVADIMRDAGITRLDLYMAAAIFSIGSVA